MVIGIVGTGRMGSANAKRLLSKGYDVIVWNRTKSKAEALVKFGAKLADSPKELAEKSDLIFIWLADNEAIRNVFKGENGLLNGLSKGKIVLNFSTITPDASKEFAKQVTERGAEYIETPVYGSIPHAEKGELILIITGKKEVLDKINNVLNDISKEIFYLGEEIGKASILKLALNLTFPAMIISVAEGLILAEKGGIDREIVAKLFMRGPGKCIIERYYDRLYQEEPPSTFPLKWMAKDLEYAMRLAYELKVPLFLTAVIEQLYKAAMNSDLGEKYYVKVFDLLRKMAGL